MSDNDNTNIQAAAPADLAASPPHSHHSAEIVANNDNDSTLVDSIKSSAAMAGNIDVEKPMSSSPEKAQETSTPTSVTDEKTTSGLSDDDSDVGEDSAVQAASTISEKEDTKVNDVAKNTIEELGAAANAATSDNDDDKSVTSSTDDEKEGDDVSTTDKNKVTGVSSGAAITSPEADTPENTAAVQAHKDNTSSPDAVHKSIFGGPFVKQADKVVGAENITATTEDTELRSAPALDKGKEPAYPISYDFTTTGSAPGDRATDGEIDATNDMVDIYGNPIDDETPPSCFGDWIKYLVYCEQGTQICCEFGRADKDGNIRVQKRFFVPKKLLTDFSPVFKKMLSGPWMEAKKDTMSFEDIDPMEFYRLIQVLKSGVKVPQINLGKRENILSNLCKIYLLADRYLMVDAQAWVKLSVMDYLQRLATNWHVDYQRDTVVQRDPNAEEFHNAQLMDVSNTYTLVAKMGEDRCPVKLSELSIFAAFHCPRNLLRKMWGQMDEDMTHEMGYHLVK